MDQSQLFSSIDTIAIVGLSDRFDRPSYQVGDYLLLQGFRIIPVNPGLSVWKGITAYPSLTAVPRDIRIDVVDIFRRSEFVYPLVVEAVERGDVKTIWMQEGIENKDAEQLARKHGLNVVTNFCMMKAHVSMRD